MIAVVQASTIYSTRGGLRLSLTITTTFLYSHSYISHPRSTAKGNNIEKINTIENLASTRILLCVFAM